MKNDKDYPDMPGTSESRPRVSLVQPFELKMNHEKSLIDLLTLYADKIEKELRVSYSEERTTPVIKKLRHLIEGIHCHPNNQSIAIFVSPLTEKYIFLQVRVNLKIIFLCLSLCVYKILQNFWKDFELFISERQSQVDIIFLPFVGLRKRKSFLFMFHKKLDR